MNVEEFYNKSEYSKIDFGSNPTLFTKKELLDFANEYLEAITVIRCCETLKDEGQATLTEYATELINMQENPKDSNKDWKIVVIQNTIGKLYETLQSL